MPMTAEGRVGTTTLVDGTLREIALDRTGAVRAARSHGSWYDAASRGNVFFGSTAAAGVAVGTALGGTMAYALHNPDGSDVDLVVMAISLGYVSGTLGAGTVVAASYIENAANAAPVAGTAVVDVCSRLGLNRSKGKAFSAATLTAAPLIMFPLFDLTAKLATTALQNAPFVTPVNGAIVIPPKTALAIGGIAAAGDTPLVVIGVLWEEIPRVV